MKGFVVAAIAAVATAFTETEGAFLGYITQFGKSYASLEEFEHRLAQFTRNHEFIAEHNLNNLSFKVGHNEMSDWTEEEYKSRLTYRPDDSHFETDDLQVSEFFGVSSPIDWREKGAVNEIQNQAACGSCWTFSTIASFEGAHFIASGNLEKFSEQMLVDCVKTCHGCNGGNVSLATNHLKRHDAIHEEDYPYKAVAETCHEFNGTGIRAKSVVNVAQKDGEAMKAALQHAPLSVAIEADKRVFQTYKSGIFDSAMCGVQLDHAVNVVGWGDEEGVEYFILRNSWGNTWGEEGYMRILIAEGAGICGIHSLPQYIIAKN